MEAAVAGSVSEREQCSCYAFRVGMICQNRLTRAQVYLDETDPARPLITFSTHMSQQCHYSLIFVLFFRLRQSLYFQSKRLGPNGSQVERTC